MKMDSQSAMLRIQEIEKNSPSALIATCAAVVVADGMITEDEEDVVTDILAALNSPESVALAFHFDSEHSVIDPDNPHTVNDQSEDELYDSDFAEATETIKAVSDAWQVARHINREKELLDLLAGKISPDLAPRAIAACIDAANADAKLQFEEGSVLAHFATAWGLEKELCANFESVFGGSWAIHTIGDVKTVVKRSSED